MRPLFTILTVVFLLNIHLQAGAQTDSVLQLKTHKFIPGLYKTFFIDNLNNIFLVSPNNQVKKINDKGDSVAVFNDVRRYGNLNTLDISNPLKIMVYYKDFATLAILDRFLNIQNSIDLRKSNILQSTAAAQSYDNNYWVFDALENKLKKINDNGNLLFETVDFRLLFDESFQPEEMIDNNGLLYLYNSIQGWIIFDYYGAYKQHVPAAGWKDIQVIGQYLCGHDSSMYYSTNYATFQFQQFTINTDISDAKKLLRFGERMAILKPDGLHIFDIP